MVPASVQEYAGTQQVTVVPTISSDRDLFGNASGLVTADWSGNGLTSGKGAYQVNDRTVVALNTATPLYRDLKTGDIGGDVLALNNELNLLGYNSVSGSDTYWRATSDGWKQLADKAMAKAEREPAGPRHEALMKQAVTARWMLEEFYVSLWAQELGTPKPISLQRIKKALS